MGFFYVNMACFCQYVISVYGSGRANLVDLIYADLRLHVTMIFASKVLFLISLISIYNREIVYKISCGYIHLTIFYGGILSKTIGKNRVKFVTLKSMA